jgi:hypothetical protein
MQEALPRTERTAMDEAPLERQVEPAPAWYRRARWQIAIVAASVALIAASGVVWWQTTRVVVIHAGPPAVAADDETPTASLASDDPIGPPVSGEVADRPASWLGVAASPDEFGVVAVWGERILWVSRDDGRTFRQELAAPEAIGGVAVGDDGRVAVARHGGRFGVLTPGGTTRWLRLDYDQALALAQGGPFTALLALATDRADGFAPTLLVTADQGRSWRRLVPPEAGDLDNALRISADGDIDLAVRSTADPSPRIRHYRGHIDGRRFDRTFDGEDPEPFGLGPDGRALPISWDDDSLRLDGRPVRDWNVVLGPAPGRALAVVDRRLVRFEGTGLAAVSERVPGRIRALAGDGIERSLAVIGDTLVRHSGRHGWRLLYQLGQHTGDRAADK